MPSPTIYSFTIKDYNGLEATHIVYTAYDAATETVGALVGNIAAYGGGLDAVTAGVIVDCRIIVDVAPDPSWKTTPVANIPIEETLLLNLNQANSKYVQSMDIPAVRDTLFTSDGRPIIASGAIAALVNQLTNAVTGIGGSSTVFAQSKFSNALTSLRDAMKSFRKHRRRRAAKSTVTP